MIDRSKGEGHAGEEESIDAGGKWWTGLVVVAAGAEAPSLMARVAVARIDGEEQFDGWEEADA